MKGFTPMKNGRTEGFQFPRNFGFTGSSGKVTVVDGYTRRKFADGGAVRKEGRMTVTKLGDVGHATVPRGKPTTAEDQASGGRGPLRAGYKKGGRMHKATGGEVNSRGRGNAFKKGGKMKAPC